MLGLLVLMSMVLTQVDAAERFLSDESEADKEKRK